MCSCGSSPDRTDTKTFVMLLMRPDYADGRAVTLASRLGLA